jgi:hypothetical protein
LPGAAPKVFSAPLAPTQNALMVAIAKAKKKARVLIIRQQPFD